MYSTSHARGISRLLKFFAYQQGLFLYPIADPNDFHSSIVVEYEPAKSSQY